MSNPNTAPTSMLKPYLLPITVHEDLRGYLFEIWRADKRGEWPVDLSIKDSIPTVKQIIMPAIHPGVIKAWHRHEKQWDIVVCLHGELQAAWWHPEYNNGEAEWTILSPRNMKKLIIPPFWYHGWKNIGHDTALVIEAVTETYNHDNPDDTRCDPHNENGEIWIRKDS